MSSVGPSLPPGFVRQTTPIEEEKPQDAPSNVGPADPNAAPTPKRSYGVFAKPPSEEETRATSLNTRTDEVIGPRMATPETAEEAERKQQLLDEKARNVELEEWKRVREGETAKKVNREEWMLHLPEGRNIATMGGARQFSKSGTAGQQLDKSWTTVGGKEDASEITKRTRQQIEEERIRAESLAVEEKLAQNDRVRGPSLVEIHSQKKQKRGDSSSSDSEHEKKKKKEKKSKKSKKDKKSKKLKKEREPPKPELVGYSKPFDRETHIVHRQMDAGRVQGMIRDAKSLHSNFVSGTNKYQ
ncbi:hypothetical protein PROFUN_05975 [Planoprotostelium fungivorum]|uniref:Uncharacterized protein n=1 Tax=Planoprotostelium fungivorum TaxID=1890364 RepID=A0A2P6NPA4_9EUKA|nr:hypothetical protein PROFUN_05975 [Planoprotostelium fungivorum]